MEFINLSKKKCYLVRCSDWSTIIEADNESEACSLSLVEMLAEEGKGLKLSPVMSTTRLLADIMDEEVEQDVSYHSVSRMLANAGFHELSSNVKTIFEQ